MRPSATNQSKSKRTTPTETQSWLRNGKFSTDPPNAPLVKSGCVLLRYSYLVELLPAKPPQGLRVEGHVALARRRAARGDLEHLDVFAHRANGEVVVEVAGAHHLQLVGQRDVAGAPARAERDHWRRCRAAGPPRSWGHWLCRRRAPVANQHLGSI